MDIGELERALAAGPGWPPVAALGLDALRQEMTAVWVSVRGASGDGPGGDQPGYDVRVEVGLLEAAVSMLVNQTSNALCAAVELPAQVAEVAGADRR